MSALPRRRLSIAQTAAALMVAAAALTLLGLVGQGRGIAGRYYQPMGYLAQVKALVRAGVITYDKARCNDEPQSRAMRLCFHRDRASKEVVDFHDTSYLKDDVLRFRSGEPGSFYVQGGRLEVSDRDRRLALPFADRERNWEGKLEYREGGPSALLETEQATFRILKPQKSQLPLKPEQHSQLSMQSAGDSRSGYAFDLTDQGQLGSFAGVEFIGDDLVLSVDRRSPEVKVNGQRIPVGTRVRLDDGDVLLAEKPGLERVFFLRSSSERDVLSRSRELNGQKVRTETPGRFPLGHDLAEGIAGVAAASRSEQRRVFDVRLSVDRQLHEAVQGRLEAFIEANGGRAAPAAVTLLDAQSGEILALASYPPPRAIARFQELGADIDTERLALNQNLLLHPIGSTIKPFLAAAIWHVAPRLADLRIRTHSADTVEEVLGIKLTKPLRTLVHEHGPKSPGRDAYVEDRRIFFKHSCNLYLANLFLLALALPPGGGDSPAYTDRPLPDPERVRLGAELIERAPDVSYYVHADRVDHLELHPFAEALRDAFDVDVAAVESTDPAWNTAARYDTKPLRELLLTLGVGAANEPSARPLFAASPERVNLRLNQVQTLRAQLISLLAGGASAEWNNVKLAEGMARLGTGRAIQARLIRSVRKADGKLLGSSEPAPPLRLSAEALEWVREGILLPTEPGGTAAALGPRLDRWQNELGQILGRKDVELVYYSKTGTPRKRDEGADSAAYIFYLGLKQGGQLAAAISGSIYIQDRGGSALAVHLAEGILQEVVGYLPRHQE